MDLPPLFKQLYESAFTPRQVVAGFSRSGIWPYDPNAMKEKVAKPSLLQTSSNETSAFAE